MPTAQLPNALTIPIIDCHVHLAPDQVAAKNIEHMTRMAGYKPACLGTVDDLLQEMRKAGIAKSIVNNIVNDPQLVSKANDWTAKTVAAHPDRLAGLAWIHPQMERADREIERCIRDLGLKGVKLHFSNTKIHPDDAKALTIYETCADLDVPVLVHCGPNVEDANKPQAQITTEQYSRPSHFETIAQHFPKLRMILAHLAGAEHYKEEACKLLDNHPNIMFDTALGSALLTQEMVLRYSHARILFGSDYPVVHPTSSVDSLSDLPVDGKAMRWILQENAVLVFRLE